MIELMFKIEGSVPERLLRERDVERYDLPGGGKRDIYYVEEE